MLSLLNALAIPQPCSLTSRQADLSGDLQSSSAEMGFTFTIAPSKIEGIFNDRWPNHLPRPPPDRDSGLRYVDYALGGLALEVIDQERHLGEVAVQYSDRHDRTDAAIGDLAVKFDQRIEAIELCMIRVENGTKHRPNHTIRPVPRGVLK